MNFLMKKFLKSRVDLYDDFIRWIASEEGKYWLRELPAANTPMDDETRHKYDELMKIHEEDEDIYITQNNNK